MVDDIFTVLTTADTASIRYEMRGSINYMVVPVVALVEGVLHSANAEDAELALAQEFGRWPGGWDGRPLVMNHPKVNEEFVSANSPEILDSWSFGQIFNTALDGKKLKTEAWIDIGRAAQLGGEFQSTVDRIQQGQVVEISTGLMASVENASGTFDGKDYNGIWRNIIPDHLALLSEGTIGACSIEGGCGAPRINEFKSLHIRTQLSSSQIKGLSSSRPNEPVSGSCSCGCGGTCQEGSNSVSKPVNVANGGKKGPTTGDLPDIASTAEEDNPNTGQGVSAIMNSSGRTHEEIIAKANKAMDRLQVNSYPADMPVENVRTLLYDALADAVPDLFYIYTFTQDTVVYETWSDDDAMMQSFNITGDNKCVLGNDAQEVFIMTKIVPANEPGGEDDNSAQPMVNSEGAAAAGKVNEGTSGAQSQTENTMTTNPDQTAEDQNAAAGAEGTSSTPAESTPATTPAVNSAPITVNQYIEAAPAEVREVLQEGLRMHTEKRNNMIAQIIANKSNTFTEESLRAMTMENLAAIHKLAAQPTQVVNNYGGRALPQDPNTASGDDMVAPRPMEAFPVKKPEAGAA